jgi:DNA-binding GntR family transcriptional regulator
MDEDPIVQGLLVAISQKRLRPGTKLGEDQLARAFGTSRIRVRQALAHLASRRVVIQIPNRGAFVHQPTWEEAKSIFLTRQIIETAAIEAVLDRLDVQGEAAIRAQLAHEAADSKDDRWASLALTADFHVLIAELSGNSVLLEIAREIILRTSLAIATFEQPGAHDCLSHSHPGIAELLLARDKAGAIAAMRKHLSEMEHSIMPPVPQPDPDDIGAIFRGIGIKPIKRRRLVKRSPAV